MTRPPGTLDAEALRVFAEKGLSYWADTTPNSVPPHNQNGVKVRRIMQLTADLAHKPFGELRILDLGCGEGVYAVEAGLKGASVVALDARRDRMRQGVAIAERLGLSNVSFDQMDIRTIQSAQLGSFDVIYCLGILYHLMAADAIALLRSLHAMTTGPVIIDTMIAPKGEDDIVYDGRTYAGKHVQEHPEDRPLGDRRKAILQSLDNTFSFYFTKPSLTSLLVDVGFTSVCECFAPFEPGKSADRVTMVALKGERVTVATYPWVAHRTEAELADLIAHRPHGLTGVDAMLVAPQPYPRGTEKQTRSAPRTVFGILDYCDGVRADLLHAQIREWNPDATIILLDNASPYNAARSATHVNGVNTYVGGGIRDLICLAEEAGALYLLFCASDVEICDPLTIRNFENFMEAHPKAVQFSCSTTRDSHQAKYFPWMARRRGGSPRRVRHADLLCCMLRLDFVRSFGGFPLSRGGWGYDRELAYHAQRGRKAIYVNDRCTVRHIDSRPRIAAEAGKLIDKGKEMETVYAARYGNLAVLSIPETRLDRVRRRWSRLRKKLKSRLRRLKTSSWSQSHSG